MTDASRRGPVAPLVAVLDGCRRTCSHRARSVGAIHLAAAGALHLAVGVAVGALAVTGSLRSTLLAGASRVLSDTVLLAVWPTIETVAAVSPLVVFLAAGLGLWQLRDAWLAWTDSRVGLASAIAGVLAPVTAPLSGIALVLLGLTRSTDSGSDVPDTGRIPTREMALVGAVLVVGYLAVLAPVAVASGIGLADVTALGGPEQPSSGTNGSDTATPGGTQFELVSTAAGIDYRANDTYRGSNGMISNAGSYVLDYDGDGAEDVLLIGGDRPVLFENDGGQFAPSGALPAVDGPVRGALAFDYDGDGREDLLLLRTNATAVFLENTGGAYERRQVGLSRHFESPIGATTADYTGNGCLDVLVYQYGDWIAAHPEGERNYNVSEGADNGHRNRLFAGDCGGFAEVTNESGLSGARWSLAASSIDLTGDGLPDVHVANDFNYDYLYRNLGNGTFEQVRLGERTNRNGMSSEVADLTGDGRQDVFATNIYFPGNVEDEMATTMQFRADGNNLLANGDDGGLVDAAADLGVARGGWGWAAVAADFDNDGSTDLFHTTRNMTFRYADGRFSRDERRRLHAVYSFYQYPALFAGNGSGFDSRNPAAAGFQSSDGRGTAGFDYDGDGDVDLLVANAEGQYLLYENTVSDGSALQVDVRGSNEAVAVGAEVTVTTADRTRQRPVTAETDFLSQDSRVLHFGFEESRPAVVRVRWPDGTERTISDVEPGRRLVVHPNGTVERNPFDATDST